LEDIAISTNIKATKKEKQRLGSKPVLQRKNTRGKKISVIANL